jgi:hypothetical protein
MTSRYHSRTTVENPAWDEVGRAEPCPRCGATSGCSILENREFVRCLTVVSQWPVLTGGWLHALPAPVSLAATPTLAAIA